MTDLDSSRAITSVASSSKAARTVLDPAERRYLEPFLGRELGAAEAASEVGVTLAKMAYRVHALTSKGLLQVSGQRPRHGRSVTLYRAAAEIQIPLALLPYSDLRDFFALADAGLRDVFLSSLARLAGRSGFQDWMIRLYRAHDETVRLDLSPSDEDWDPTQMLKTNAPAITFNWVPLALTRAEAKELQRDLTAILGRYHVATSSPSHLLGLFLTPTEKST